MLSTRIIGLYRNGALVKVSAPSIRCLRREEETDNQLLNLGFNAALGLVLIAAALALVLIAG